MVISPLLTPTKNISGKMEKNYVLVYNKIQNRKEMSDRYHILSNK